MKTIIFNGKKWFSVQFTNGKIEKTEEKNSKVLAQLKSVKNNEIAVAKVKDGKVLNIKTQVVN
jgi:hypothetical protein